MIAKTMLATLGENERAVYVTGEPEPTILSTDEYWQSRSRVSSNGPHRDRSLRTHILDTWSP